MTAFSDYLRLADLVAHVSYKPGLEILPELNGELLQAVVFREIADSQPPHAVGTIVSRHEIDMSLSDAEILRVVYDALLECETHESLEWFRVDGEAVFDPHREDSEEASG